LHLRQWSGLLSGETVLFTSGKHEHVSIQSQNNQQWVD
jgi:hypothetical protein